MTDAATVTGMPKLPGRGLRRLSLRARLVLLVVATIVPLTAFTLARRYFDYQKAIESAGHETLTLARSLRVAVEKDLQARITILQVLARSSSLREGNVDAFRLDAEAVVADQFSGSSILLLLPDGQQVMNTRLPQGAPLPARPSLKSLRQVLAIGRPAVSDVFQGTVVQGPLVSIDVPVRRSEGTITYVLSLNPSFDAFADTIRRQQLPEGWSASVLDREGANVAHNLSSDQAVGQTTVATLRQHVAIEPEGVFLTRSHEGIEVVSAFSHVEPFGWSVVVGIPLSELTAPAVSAALRTLGAAGVALLIGVILAIIVARQVTRPIQALQRLAGNVDGEEILMAPSTGLTETDQVAQALGEAERRRRQSEAKRNEAERRSRRVFETSQDVILITDGYGKLIQVSPSSMKTLGYRPEEMAGHGGQDFIFPEDLELTRTEMRATRHGRATRQFRCRYVHKDGHMVPLVWIAVWSEVDHLHYFIGRDMTDYERTEEQLRQAQKMEAVGQLTGGVAHDFNNILMVIMANTEALAEEEKLDPSLREHLNGIDNATQRAADLTRQLLAFSRKQALRPQRTSINDLVMATAKLLRRTLGELIEIESILADELWNVEVDRAQLESALVNLSINSRDAMPSGGRLLIETKNVELDFEYAATNTGVASGDYVMLAVTDTGNGMPPDILARVFEPFFTTKEVGKGTGLGLSMVYGFIKQSNGHIKIYSEVDRGTSIKLYLPRNEDKQEIATARQSAAMSGGNERILVVEDDGQVRAAIVRQLQSLGYAVAEASDGMAALAALEVASEPFDLLLTDVVMPGALTGEALAKEATGRWQEMKVVFMSGYTQDAMISQGRLAAGVLLLSKPFRKADLAEIVRRALGQPSSPRR
jgi:PAS domain S-box-containing protein